MKSLSPTHAKDPAIIHALIEAGSEVNYEQTRRRETALTFAARFNPNVDVLKALLSAGSDANAVDESAMTPLLLAAKHDREPEVVRRLLDAGADINEPNFSGETPLMIAAQDNTNPEVVKVLLDAGADATLKSYRDFIAFDYAKTNHRMVGTEVYWLLSDAQF